MFFTHNLKNFKLTFGDLIKILKHGTSNTKLSFEKVVHNS